MRTFTARHLVAVGLAAAAVAGVGVARAAIPSPGGSITSCINPNTGALRVVDAQASQGCSSFERSVTWNQQGQQGPRGNAGPAGPAGPQGPAGPAGPSEPDTILVSRRSGRVGQVPGCQYTPGVVGRDCGRHDAGTVSLPPGTWEVTAQVLVNSTARGFAQDNRREVTCGPELNPARFGVGGDAILAVVPDADLDVRAQWTWIVASPGPANLTWNLGCVVSWPNLFNSVSDRTDTYLDNSVLIARPVAAVVSS